MKNSGIRIVGFLCILATLLTMAVQLCPAVQAVEDGLDIKTMQIVIPKNSTKMEQTVASELKRYIFNITGVNLYTVQEGENSGPGIYIGATDFAADHNVTYPTQNDVNGEAWAIQTVNGNLVLCGAEQRGVQYAAYHFLEDVLGVRWWNFWEEDIPSTDGIIPADYADSGVPALEYREIFIGKRSTEDSDFYVHNRMNGSILYAPAHYGDTEYYGPPAHTHTFSLYFPEKYEYTDPWREYITDNGGDFSTNPEWYSLDEDGNRATNQLCLSNEGLRREFASRLVKSIEYSYREADAAGANRPICFAIVPNDNINFCQCSLCQSAIAEYGASGYVLRFVNEMAAAITAAGFTDAVLEMAAYAVYRDPPVGVVPAKNVQIRFADSGRDLLHGLNHENNKDSLARLQEWISISSNNVYNWQYVVNYNNNGVFPSMFYYGDEFTTMQKMGVNGWFAEQEQCINVDFWDMKLWLIAKLMEKPVTGEEYAELMDEFIYGYYGDAAGVHIREYLYYMHERAEATNAYQQFGTHIIGAEWLSVQDVIAGNGYFEKAFAAAAGDAKLLRRLRAARSGLDRVILENFTKWEQQAEDAQLQLTFTKREVGERVFKTIDEQVKLRGDYDIDYPALYYRYDRFADDLPQLPQQFDGIDTEHILVYTVDDFRLAYNYKKVEDADSLTGTAARCEAAKRVADGDRGLLLSEDKGITVAVYDPQSKGLESAGIIGTITAKDIQANQGYQLCSLEWTVPEKLTGSGYVYICSDWGVQIPLMAHELQALRGQTVEVCLSIKTEGTVDGSDPSDYPVYHIDRVFVLPEKAQRNHNFVQASRYDGASRTVCQICGKLAAGAETPTVPGNSEQPGSAGEAGGFPIGEDAILMLVGVAMLDLVAIVFAIMVFKKRR